MDRRIPSRGRLLSTAVARALAGVLLLGGLLFVPAGTLRFWQAWLYLGVLFVPLSAVVGVLLLRDPELLERRMRVREKEARQRRIVALSSVLLAAVFLVPGFDRRYTWSSVPPAVVVAADLLVLAEYALFVLCLRTNPHASRTVEVEPGQVVVSTGPYSWVRHPIYLAASVMFGASPLALGSYWGLIPALLFPFALVARIESEERLLRRELAGYEEYCRTVKHRLLPRVW